MVELRDWIDLAFSLHVSNTCVIIPIKSRSLDSIVVIHEDNVVVLPPCNKWIFFAKTTNPLTPK
jgi:hypothetical protein